MASIMYAFFLFAMACSIISIVESLQRRRAARSAMRSRFCLIVSCTRRVSSSWASCKTLFLASPPVLGATPSSRRKPPPSSPPDPLRGAVLLLRTSAFVEPKNPVLDSGAAADDDSRVPYLILYSPSSTFSRPLYRFSSASTRCRRLVQ